MGEQTTYRVSGMTCRRCVQHVTEALTALPGVTAVTVDLDRGRATVDSIAPLAIAQAREAIVAAGYRLLGQADQS